MCVCVHMLMCLQGELSFPFHLVPHHNKMDILQFDSLKSLREELFCLQLLESFRFNKAPFVNDDICAVHDSII